MRTPLEDRTWTHNRLLRVKAAVISVPPRLYLSWLSHRAKAPAAQCTKLFEQNAPGRPGVPRSRPIISQHSSACTASGDRGSTESAKRAYDLLAPAYDDFTHALDYEPWLQEVLPRLEQYDLAGQRLLDIGCGTGKSIAPMLERGWEATGCDISPAMLEIATKRLGDRVRLEVADMRALPHMGRFDLVWSLNDSMNYLDGPTELKTALLGMRENLAASGILVFDVNTLLSYRIFFAERTVVDRNGRRLIWDGHASNDQAPGSACEATFEVERAGKRELRHTHRQRHFPEADILTALGSADLECLRVFGQGEWGALDPALDETEHVKALYIARATPNRAGSESWQQVHQDIPLGPY